MAGKATGLTFGNLGPIEREIVRRKAGLLIFDPVQSYFGDDKDSHKATEVRPRMDALISLAKRHNIAVLLIRHLSKAPVVDRSIEAWVPSTSLARPALS